MISVIPGFNQLRLNFRGRWVCLVVDALYLCFLEATAQLMRFLSVFSYRMFSLAELVSRSLLLSSFPFPLLGGGSTNEVIPHQNRRSLKEMEKALQTTLHSSSAKNKLYENVVRSITPSGSSHSAMPTTPSPLTLSSKPAAKKFDLKFICPHGNALTWTVGKQI